MSKITKILFLAVLFFFFCFKKKKILLASRQFHWPQILIIMKTEAIIFLVYAYFAPMIKSHYHKGQWRSQDLRLGGARLKDNIKRKII